MAKLFKKLQRKASVGHTVSHSNIKTLRRFKANLVTKKIFDEDSGKMVRVKLPASILRTMTNKGYGLKTMMKKLKIS